MFIIDTIIAGAIIHFWQSLAVSADEKTDQFAKHLADASDKDAFQTEQEPPEQPLLELMNLSSSDARQRQLQEFGHQGKSEQEQEIDRNLALSSGALGVSALGVLVYPPVQLLALPALFVTGVPIFKEAYRSVFKEGKLKIEVLDAISIVAILATGHFVFCAAAATMYFASKKVLVKTEDHSIARLVNIMGEQPRTVWVVRGDIKVEILFEQLQVGDTISLRAGEVVPVDGIITRGHAIMDEHALTGEAQPAEKAVGSTCFASTLILEGRLQVRVEKEGSETAAAQIGKILQQSIGYKDHMISKGKRLADASVLPVLALGAASLPVVGAIGSVTILNASFGYNLRMVSPVLMLNLLTIASKEGILIKDGRSLELLSKIDTLVFDKTGTLTLPQPQVAQIHTLNGTSHDQILSYAAAAEFRQSHPIALAILEAARIRKLKIQEIEEAKYEVGYGIKVSMDGELVRIGSLKFMELESVDVPDSMLHLAEEGHQLGYSFVYLAVGDRLEGAIELRPAIRPEAARVIEQMKASGKECYIISGDHEAPTRHLAAALGIEKYFAGVLPEQKAQLVEGLQKKGKKVCFVGDGINDSIALKKADVSVSLRGASTIATDTAQVVLMKESLGQLPLLFHLGDQFDTHMKRNLLWSVVPSIITIGGVFLFNFGLIVPIILNPIGLLGGVSTSMRPLVRYQEAKRKLPKASGDGAFKTKPEEEEGESIPFEEIAK